MLSAVILCVLILLLLQRWSLRRHNLPPSPPGDLFIGHALRIPRTYPWKTFASWTKDYGSYIYSVFENLTLKSITGNIVYYHVFGRPTIVLNSYEIAKDLLDKRGSLYVDRPRLVLVQEMYRKLICIARVILNVTLVNLGWVVTACFH